MKAVQTALADIGIRVMAAAWMPDANDKKAPDQYVTYSHTAHDIGYQDDLPTEKKTYVYLNLWSLSDPTEMAKKIRNAMYANGFVMIDEGDMGYRQNDWNELTRRYSIQWTWLLRETIDYADGCSGDAGADQRHTETGDGG